MSVEPNSLPPGSGPSSSHLPQTVTPQSDPPQSDPPQSAPPLLDLFARMKRAWMRDNHLSLQRRIQKAVQFGTQLVRAKVALRSCNRVGANARVAGRMHVRNHGLVIVGHHLNVNSTWIPTEFLTGREGRIEIGDDVLINYGTMIAAGRGVTIGSGSMIGPHCIIADVDIPEQVAGFDAVDARPVRIGKDVWLAGRVTVRPGVTIGDGAVIVAGSIVETDVPAHVMASGIPARLIPKLSAVPRPKLEPGAAPATAPRPARPGAVRLNPAVAPAVAAVPPELSGNLISDFVLDELVGELLAPGADASLNAVVAARDFPAALRLPPPAEGADFAVVWSRPQAAVPAFARVLAGGEISEGELNKEVDAFCAQIERTAAAYPMVFVPTWTLPAYMRGRGVLDMRQCGTPYALEAMNLRMTARLMHTANVHVLDASRWLAAVGPAGSNPRAWYLGQMAMARPVVAEAALDIRAAVAALRGRQRTLLVVGVDDTLWGGASAELGWDAVWVGGAGDAGEAFADFQRGLQSLAQRGIALALLGKGGKAAEAAAFEVLRRHPGMVLREGDFAGWQFDAPDAAEGLAALAARLKVEPNAVSFVSADAAARARVREKFPEVLVAEWPDDPLLFPSALQQLRCFDAPPARPLAARSVA